jgi:hypothetical protein
MNHQHRIVRAKQSSFCRILLLLRFSTLRGDGLFHQPPFVRILTANVYTG